MTDKPGTAAGYPGGQAEFILGHRNPAVEADILGFVKEMVDAVGASKKKRKKRKRRSERPKRWIAGQAFWGGGMVPRSFVLGDDLQRCTMSEPLTVSIGAVREWS